MQGVWQSTTLVALKSLHVQSHWEEFQAEAKMLMKLKHPNVVSFFGFYNHEGQSYMVTEYLPLGSVLELIQTKGKELSLAELLKMYQFYILYLTVGIGAKMQPQG